ncbi:unnamed protein product [marine sediment metagenome]|uniref:Uncharacterized protein n=1 Tax=marine sediment metagenome TaxID=412755 RepID=X1H6S3_9ZZZZ
MPFKTTTRGNGIKNSRIHTVKGGLSYNPSKLKKYLVLRKYRDERLKREVFMFQLQYNDIVVELLPLKEGRT